MTRRLIWLALALAACTVTPPPAPPAPRAGLPLSVSAGRTWDAVIEQFAETSVPIRTMERASGIIVTEDMGISPANGLLWANCGKDILGDAIAASLVSYNVLVRGDSTSSVLRVTARWVSSSGGSQVECTTRNAYEPELEESIAKRARS